MQAKKQAPKTEQLLREISAFYGDFLGYAPEKTTLQEIPESEWTTFTKSRELNQDSSGIYLPRNQTATIKENNHLSLFHEYFGHGLYCEQSILGRQLVSLEKKLLNEEKQEFRGKKFSLEDLQKFRQQSQAFQQLQDLKQKNLGTYEGFAVWTEYFLSGEFGSKQNFERKYDSLTEQDQKGVQDIVNFSKQWGNLATFYAFDMARRTTPERVRRLLGEIYGSKLDEIKLAILYGSRKEFSDIDVFMLGKNPKESHSGFLDIKMRSIRDLQRGIKNFDIRFITPLMNGEFILGNRNYFLEAKQQILLQPITEEAIRYNLKWSFRMKRLRDENSRNEFLRSKFEGYFQTYLANALALKEGKRLFTRESWASYSPSEKTIQLKGGTENNAT